MFWNVLLCFMYKWCDARLTLLMCSSSSVWTFLGSGPHVRLFSCASSRSKKFWSSAIVELLSSVRLWQQQSERTTRFAAARRPSHPGDIPWLYDDSLLAVTLHLFLFLFSTFPVDKDVLSHQVVDQIAIHNATRRKFAGAFVVLFGHRRMMPMQHRSSVL